MSDRSSIPPKEYSDKMKAAVEAILDDVSKERSRAAATVLHDEIRERLPFATRGEVIAEAIDIARNLYPFKDPGHASLRDQTMRAYIPGAVARADKRKGSGNRTGRQRFGSSQKSLYQ